jgi:hypothetical protein
MIHTKIVINRFHLGYRHGSLPYSFCTTPWLAGESHAEEQYPVNRFSIPVADGLPLLNESGASSCGEESLSSHGASGPVFDAEREI